MQHGHAECSCSKDMQRDIQCGHAAWIISMDIQHGQTTYKSHGQVPWSSSMEVVHGRAAGTCSVDLQHGDQYMQQDIYMQHGHGMPHGHGHAAWA
jgi:hypothetical protein